MYQFMVWLEASGLGHTMRESSLWTYPVVNLLHILGVASLFGALLVLDLRLLGLWRGVSLAAISLPTVPVATVGGIVALVSGVCLISTNTTEYAGNAFLMIKFPAVALGLLNVVVLGRLPAWQRRASREPDPRERRQLALCGGVSLTCWLTAVSAGRMIGYW